MIKGVDKDLRRKALEKYKNNRLRFEGVLCDIIQPNKRNGYTYGLVFASLYAIHEDIELDHVVIKSDNLRFDIEPKLFNRYQFTAKIDSYYKIGKIIGIPVQKEHFMLTEIKRLKVSPNTKLEQPTKYVQRRIKNIMASKNIKPIHSYNEIINIISKMTNDGSVEKFINQYSQIHQHRSFGKYDVINKLYKKENDYGNDKQKVN